MSRGPPITLLFILVMEVLSKMIDRVVGGGRLTGFIVEGSNGDVLTISHLLFAYDTTLFCGGSNGANKNVTICIDVL